MKKTFVTVLILALTLALCQTALAEPSNTLQSVYDALVAEGSDFSKAQALYAEYYEGVTLEAALEDNSITVTLDSKNEYVESGAWTFTLEDDTLTTTLIGWDFYGYSMANSIMSAAVTAQGVNSSLFNGYISALGLTGETNPWLTYEDDEAAGTTTIAINIVGPYELNGLDDMVMTEGVLSWQDHAPLDEEDISRVVNFGKITLLVNGNAENAMFLVMEYGELDDLALQTILLAAKTLQPSGWEDFVAGYTALENAATDAYTVTVNADEAAVGEIIEDADADYSAMIVTFG